MSDDLIPKNDEILALKDSAELEPVTSYDSIVPEKPSAIDLNLEQDLKYSKDSLVSTIEILNRSMQNLADTAEMSQSPRAYEVVAKMADSISNSVKNLISLHKDQKEIEKPQQDNKLGGINNNIVLADLNSILEAYSKKKEDPLF